MQTTNRSFLTSKDDISLELFTMPLVILTRSYNLQTTFHKINQTITIGNSKKLDVDFK